MSEPTPHESDLILGGQNPPPVDAVILGGLSSVKQRLESESIAERLWALNNAVQYGDNAIDLALKALTDDAGEVRRLAKRLLRDRLGEVGKKALLDRDPINYFTTLNDWNREIYHPSVGIVDPKNNAYMVKIDYSHTDKKHDLSKFHCLMKEPNIKKLEALIVKIEWIETNSLDNDLDCDVWWLIFNAINETTNMQNIKGLQIGDEIIDRDKLVRRHSKLAIWDISAILDIFPNLEILHIHGNFKFYYLVDTELKHDKLKTFIIDTTCLKKMTASLCPIEMPELEYFEYFLNCGQRSYQGINAILPLLSGVAAPNLKYLSLNEYSDDFIKEIIKTPIFNKISVLRMTIGLINDLVLEEAFNILIDCKLKLLTIYFRFYNDSSSRQAIDKIRQLPFTVILPKQSDDIFF